MSNKDGTYNPHSHHGSVQVNLGIVNHSSFGEANVKFHYPRLQPRHEREEVPGRIVQRLIGSLMEWVWTHYPVTEHNEDYYEELAKTAILFTLFVDPLPSVDSPEFALEGQIFFWLWQNDDDIEASIEAGASQKDLMVEANKVLDALTFSDEDKENVVEKTLPSTINFSFRFKALLDLRTKLQAHLPGYQASMKPFLAAMKSYYEAQGWICCDKIDSRYSERTFREWRRTVGFFRGIASVTALIHHVQVPESIRQSSLLKRLVNITDSFGAFANDLIGMKKEFANNQKDNIIIYKVLQKGEDIHEATAQVCHHLEEELQDFVLLKNVLLQRFEGEPSLVKFVDILESLIDGHNRFYLESSRHRCIGCVTLINYNGSVKNGSLL